MNFGETGDGFASGAGMATIALASVGLWTLRVACAARGRKLLGAAVAAVEAVVFALAFSRLAANLDAPVPVLGYAVGVAAGTLLGLVIDERGSHGKTEIKVLVDGEDRRVAETLAELGWPATSFPAQGPGGLVTVAFVAVDDGQVPHVLTALRRAFPDAVWSIQQLRRLHPHLLTAGVPSAPVLDSSSKVHRRPHRPIHPAPNPTRRNSHVHH